MCRSSTTLSYTPARWWMPDALRLPLLCQVVAQLPRRGGEALQFEIRLFERDLVVLARREAAIRVQRQPFGRHVLKRFAHALGDGFRRVDLREAHVHAA